MSGKLTSVTVHPQWRVAHSRFATLPACLSCPQSSPRQNYLHCRRTLGLSRSHIDLSLFRLELRYTCAVRGKLDVGGGQYIYIYIGQSRHVDRPCQTRVKGFRPLKSIFYTNGHLSRDLRSRDTVAHQANFEDVGSCLDTLPAE
jgi:hypothetical protein